MRFYCDGVPLFKDQIPSVGLAKVSSFGTPSADLGAATLGKGLTGLLAARLHFLTACAHIPRFRAALILRAPTIVHHPIGIGVLPDPAAFV